MLRFFPVIFLFFFIGCAPWQTPYIASSFEYQESPKKAKSTIHTILNLISIGKADLEKLRKKLGFKKFIILICLLTHSFSFTNKRRLLFTENNRDK